MNRKIFKLLILLGVFLLLVTACNGAEEGPAEVPAAEGADVSQATPPAEALPATEASGAAEEAAASGQTGTGEPYKVGLFFSVTGPISSLGIPERDTAMMVVEQVNAAGGIKEPDGLMHPLEVVFEDDQSSPDEAVLIVKKLIDQDQVPVIVLKGTAQEFLADEGVQQAYLGRVPEASPSHRVEQAAILSP